VTDTRQQPSDERWLAWLRGLQAVAQEGLLYAQNPFDRARYEQLKVLSTAMGEALVEAEPGRVRALLDAEPGYLTPKLDVRAAVHDADGRLLLVRETQDGRWSLPGGWADVGESLAEGAVREVFEETGFVVEVDRLLGIYERERWGHPPMLFFTLKSVLACRMVSGTATTSAETSEIGWFGRDELPELSLGRTSPQLVARVFEHFDDPALPPDLS
jgi:ADP-ribose pyrophosphatase YjhB (NUDIX family)